MMVNTLVRIFPFMVSYFSFHSPIAESKDFPDCPVAQLAISEIDRIANTFVGWHMIVSPGFNRYVGQSYVSFFRVTWFPYGLLAKTSGYVQDFCAGLKLVAEATGNKSV